MPLFLALLLLPLPMPQVLSIADDPSPGVLTSKADARALDCTPLSDEEAHARFPGLVPEKPPRGSYLDSRTVACKRLVFPAGVRAPGQEAMLSRLSATAGEVAAAAESALPKGTRWVVEAFHPDPAISSKLGFAAKVALVQRGLTVSDRAPTVAAGDVLVFGRLPPFEAYPLACARYQAEGALKDGQALLGVVQLDAKETVLHAGVCANGEWRWVQ